MKPATRMGLVVLATMAGGMTWAAEGRIPIFEPIVLDGTVGPIDGNYILTNNIEQISAAPAIQVIGTGSEQVEIDLNGFNIIVSADGTRALEGTNLRTMTVRNGTMLSRATSGDTVFISTTVRVEVEDLTIIGEGQTFGAAINLGNIQNFSVRGNTIINPFSHGIRAVGSVGHGKIEENLIRDTGEHGIHLPSPISSVVVRNNQVQRTGLNGINAAPGGVLIISDNAVELAGRRGIFVNKTRSCRLSDNVIRGSGSVDPANGDGIFLNNDAVNCTLKGNTVSDNEAAGLHIRGSRHHLQANVVNDNATFGIWFNGVAGGSDNTFGGNTARGNQGVGGNCGAARTCTGVGLQAPDFCDSGTNNSSFRNNLAPGPDPC